MCEVEAELLSHLLVKNQLVPLTEDLRTRQKQHEHPLPLLGSHVYPMKVSLPADDLADGLWSATLLEDIMMFLDLDKSLAEGFYPMTERARLSAPRPKDPRACWEERVGPFRESLPPQGEPRCIVLRDLMVVVALRCGYDARSRVTFRRVCDAMQVEWHPRVSEVESTLARKVYERVNAERERELRGDRWRGVKIGAAMLGGGAVLAVTGGLAAPLFAAGVAASSSIIGTTAAATLSGFATTAWMATVFGATGAGLVGFKMDRRTKGVKEFEFQSQTSVGEEMSVAICVPGVLKDKADLQRAWGIEPRGPDVSAMERLRRFYYVYNRDKVGDVVDILEAYDGREVNLCKGLKDRYGADPRDPPTREALARAEGRPLEDVSQEDVARDAEAIGKLMEAVLKKEKQGGKEERAKVVANAVEHLSQEKNHAEEATLAGAGSDMHPGEAARNPASASNAHHHHPSGGATNAASRTPAHQAPGGSGAAGAGVSHEKSPGVVVSPQQQPGGIANEGGDGAPLLVDWNRDEQGRVDPVVPALKDMSLDAGPSHAKGEANAPVLTGVTLPVPTMDASGNVTDNIELVVDDDFTHEPEEKKEKEDLLKHRVWFWQDHLRHTDQYVLKWESDWMVTVGKSVETLIKSLSQSAMQEVLKYTTLATLVTSLTWPLALISLSNMIDADWTIGRERADIAGKILADALLNREQGCRPVTLIGTSLGARLIFACLEEIARRHELWEEQMQEAGGASVPTLPPRSKMTRAKNAVTLDNKGKSKVGLNGVGVPATAGAASSGRPSEAEKSNRKRSGVGKNDAKCAAGVIENVCLLGTPLGASAARWERVARVVHGRIINGYSKSDVILGLVFRAKSLSLSVAGVQKVTAPGIENVDLSPVVGSSHFNYNRKMPEILALLALDDCSKYVGRGDPPEEPAADTALRGDVTIYGTTVVP